jgi:hypothetical protein
MSTLSRCRNCIFWKQSKNWPKGGVCMIHSLWVNDSRDYRGGGKRSRRSKPKFRELMTRYTDVCNDYERLEL